MKKQTDRWTETSIGLAGIPLADELAALLETWARQRMADPSISPWDVAHIAREVILQIAAETKALQAHNRWLSEQMAARREPKIGDTEGWRQWMGKAAGVALKKDKKR